VAQKGKNKKDSKKENKDVIVEISSQKDENPKQQNETEETSREQAVENKQDKKKKDKKEKQGKTVPLADYQQLERELEEQKNSSEQMKDKYYRLAAEFDNFKKRTNRDQMIFQKYAGEKVLAEIIHVYDDLARAMENKTGEVNDDSTGLAMIYKKFSKALENLDVKPIKTIGEMFDPDLHHALMVREEEGVEPDKVLEEFEKGYMYKDKVLKHAKVVVSK
jgi:molecular chaperone GrpE